MFCPTKDKVNQKHKSNVIYRIVCPGCGESYIGKTERFFLTRMKEHGEKPNQPMNIHLTSCSSFQNMIGLFALPQLFNDSDNISYAGHLLNAVLDNCEIIDSNNNWSQLCFLEAYYIKKYRPFINKGLKASKELQLFS